MPPSAFLRGWRVEQTPGRGLRAGERLEANSGPRDLGCKIGGTRQLLREAVARRLGTILVFREGSGVLRRGLIKRYRTVVIQDSSKEGLFELRCKTTLVKDPNSLGNGGQRVIVGW